MDGSYFCNRFGKASIRTGVDSDWHFSLDAQENTINVKVSGVSIQAVSKLPPMSVPGIQKSVDSDGCQFRMVRKVSGMHSQSVDLDGSVDSDGVSIQTGRAFSACGSPSRSGRERLPHWSVARVAIQLIVM